MRPSQAVPVSHSSLRSVPSERRRLTMRRPFVSLVAVPAVVCGLALAVATGRSEHARPVQAAAQQSGSELADPFEVGAHVVAEGLISPIGIVSAFDGSGRLFVLEQTGVIRILTREGQLPADPFLDA